MANTQVATQKKQAVDQPINNSYVEGIMKQLSTKQEYGLTFPADYNPTNALMGAYLELKEATDKNGKPVLESCSKESIANSLMDMVTLGLSVQKKQAYFIPYSGKLQLRKSYHGNKTIAHRCGVGNIYAEVIYEGDVFKYHIEDGRKVLDTHQQDFLSINLSKILGAYAVLEMPDKTKYLEVMNFTQIETAWKKGYGYKKGAGTHAEFADMMAKKTVINRACSNVIQQHGDDYVVSSYEKVEESSQDDVVAEDVAYDIAQNANSEDFPVDDIVDESRAPETVNQEVEAGTPSSELLPDCFN